MDVAENVLVVLYLVVQIVELHVGQDAQILLFLVLVALEGVVDVLNVLDVLGAVRRHWEPFLDAQVVLDRAMEIVVVLHLGQPVMFHVDVGLHVLLCVVRQNRLQQHRPLMLINKI